MDSINSYIKSKRIEIGNSIKGLKTIYLDTNYWIELSKQNNSPYPENKILLNKLIHLVESNKCIIPISETTFWEIRKQGNINTLLETTSIIDKLSKGISIVTDNERRHLEFAHFIRKCSGKETYDLNQLIWTKLSLVILNNSLPQDIPIELNKSFLDFISHFSFTEIIEITNKSGKFVPFNYKDNIDFFTEAKEKYKDENKSFEQMYLSELGGFLELHAASINETMLQLFYWENGHYPTEEEKKEVNPLSFVNMIYNLSKYNKLTTELPTFRIFSKLWAIERMDKNRKYKDGNDTIDFLHATTALPYYDFFFTEGNLREMISQKKLDTLYNCIVESDKTKIIEILNSL